MLRYFSEATTSIDLCLYLITSRDLAEAVLARIVAADVRVRLILDDDSVDVQGSQVAAFRAAGAFVRSKRTAPYLMHHKFAVVDGSRLLTGSFNWTMSAIMGNRENVVVTEDPRVVEEFSRKFDELWEEVRA